MLWASFSYYLLLPDNRAPDGIAGIFAVTDGQPGWLVWIMNGLSSLAGQRGLEISIVLAIACAVVAVGVFVPAAARPMLVLAAALGLLVWLAEGLGGIFTGQGTDPNTGLLLILLAACYWPRSGVFAADRAARRRAPPLTDPRRASSAEAGHVCPGGVSAGHLVGRALIVEIGPATDRLRRQEIDDDEGPAAPTGSGPQRRDGPDWCPC